MARDFDPSRIFLKGKVTRQQPTTPNIIKHLHKSYFCGGVYIIGQQEIDGQENKQRKQCKMIGGTMRQGVMTGDIFQKL